MATATPPSPAPGSTSSVTITGVDWETYCDLRDNEENNHVRMIYLDGTLTIMSPQLRHDGNSRRFLMIVAAVADACEIDYMPIGTTTLRKVGRGPKKGAGKEADEGFYLGPDEAKVRDNDEINLANDPPPTLAIEVDNTADSEDALPAYARIGVPEVWVYQAREQRLWFGRLTEGEYVNIEQSVCLPRLTPSLVLQALEARAGKGDRLWVKWLQDWAKALPESTE